MASRSTMGPRTSPSRPGPRSFARRSWQMVPQAKSSRSGEIFFATTSPLADRINLHHDPSGADSRSHRAFRQAHDDSRARSGHGRRHRLRVWDGAGRQGGLYRVYRRGIHCAGGGRRQRDAKLVQLEQSGPAISFWAALERELGRGPCCCDRKSTVESGAWQNGALQVAQNEEPMGRSSASTRDDPIIAEMI